jgi:hypothetical protein
VQVSTNQLRTPDWVIWLAALAGPMVVTVVLLGYSNAIRRDYVFIYLGLVAVVGVLRRRRRLCSAIDAERGGGRWIQPAS